MNFAKCKPIRFSRCTLQFAKVDIGSPYPKQNLNTKSLKTVSLVPCLPARTFSLTACTFKSKNHSTDQDSLEEDEIDEAEIEELFQQQIPVGIGEEDHRVFIVHPDVKWGSKKQHLTTGKTVATVYTYSVYT